MNLNLFREFYRKSKDHIFLFLERNQWTEKQTDAVATKLDILGVFLVTQAWFGLTKYGWHTGLASVIFFLSLIVWAILWMTAFILKGWKL